MDAEAAHKGKLRFKVGLVLIAASYVLWAAAALFAAMELSDTEFPWWRVATASLVLNWIAFAAGLLLAGREAVRYLRDRVPGLLRKKPEKQKMNMDSAEQ